MRFTRKTLTENWLARGNGLGSGLGGFWAKANHPPILAAVGEEANLIVGVEASLAEIAGAPSRSIGNKSYRIWQQVDVFLPESAKDPVYIADRNAGLILFAPDVAGSKPIAAGDQKTLAPVPAKGREVRLWYRTGGGEKGNVAADTLTSLKTNIAGVTVTNPKPATGGYDAETLASAMARGPRELHSLRRAVTARDFQRLAEIDGMVARASAFTQAQVWKHAAAGTIAILLVPAVPEKERPDGHLPLAVLLQHQQDDETCDRILQRLDGQRPLGTALAVGWMRYRVIRVEARVIAFNGVDSKDLADRLRKRLDKIISPLATELQPGGWPIEQSLHVGRVFNSMFAETGVKDVPDVSLVVDEVPDTAVKSLTSDWFQSNTWHAIAKNAVFRSTNNGDSWEESEPLPDMVEGEELQLIRAHRWRAGYVAVVTTVPARDSVGGRVYTSDNCGETWKLTQVMDFQIWDVAWILRDRDPAILMACDKGLYERTVGTADGIALQIVISGLDLSAGFWTVAVNANESGQPTEVAVAAHGSKGVWISEEGGVNRTYRSISEKVAKGRDMRVLAWESAGGQSYLWGGSYAFGAAPGDGVFRWDGPVADWTQLREGWLDGAGSCYSITVCGPTILAATFGQGVFWLDRSDPAHPVWSGGGRQTGLPQQKPGMNPPAPMDPVSCVSASSVGAVALAGTDSGILRTIDSGVSFQNVSCAEFRTSVPLPATHLFCSGDHQINVEIEGRGL